MSKRVHKERPDDLVRLHVAEPAPIGLFGLSMGCLLLMCVDFELTSGKLMMIPWVFLLPASLQLIAGIWDFLRHNVFGGTAFVGYAMFWYGLSLVYYFEIEYSTRDDYDELAPPNPTIRQHTGVMSCGYLIFSVILTVISVGVNRILFSILVAIDFAFLMVILHTFYPDSVPAWLVGIGLVLVFICSLYGFAAILILKVAGGEVLPIGAPFVKWSDYIIVDGHRSKSFIKYKKQKTDDADENNVDFVEHYGSHDEEELSIQIAAGSNSQIRKYGNKSPLNGVNIKSRSKRKQPKNKQNEYYVAMGPIKTTHTTGSPPATSMDMVLQPTSMDGGV
eukprot:555580_1